MLFLMVAIIVVMGGTCIALMEDPAVTTTTTTTTRPQTSGDTSTEMATFPITYPICITVDAGTSWFIYTLGSGNYLIMDFGDAMTGEEIHDEDGRWELTSTTKTTRTYNLYWSDGEYWDTVKISSNGQAIISPGTDNIPATWD